MRASGNIGVSRGRREVRHLPRRSRCVRSQAERVATQWREEKLVARAESQRGALGFRAARTQRDARDTRAPQTISESSMIARPSRATRCVSAPLDHPSTLRVAARARSRSAADDDDACTRESAGFLRDRSRLRGA
jgi:hypothetical protein